MQIVLEGSDNKIKALLKYISNWVKRNKVEVLESESNEELEALKAENEELKAEIERLGIEPVETDNKELDELKLELAQTKEEKEELEKKLKSKSSQLSQLKSKMKE